VTSPEALNDRLAREHSIDDYYTRSPWVVRWVERRRLAIIREMLDVRAGMRLLEIGVGGGHVLRMFRQARLVGVDVSGVYLDIARKNLAGYDVQLHKGEIFELALPAASFERIVCTEVLEHVVDPEAILDEIARLLAPSGRAVITVPNDALIDGLKGWVRRTPVGLALDGRIEWGGDRYHLHRWRPAEFRALLDERFLVREQRCAPFDQLPLRACFLVRQRAGARSRARR